jgi:hypothetical protein
MIHKLDVPLGNIHFLAAHSSPRFNAETNEIFWHKNDLHNEIIRTFSGKPAADLDERIHNAAMKAKAIIKEFIKRKSIDLIIAHNTSHAYNFTTAVALGYLIKELRSRHIVWPKILVWWHDSYFERAAFSNPNEVVDKYLQYLPGTNIDGIACINSAQVEIARHYYHKYGHNHYDKFFEKRVTIVPNTGKIDWKWKNCDWENGEIVSPPHDNYNSSFFKDVGLLKQIKKMGFTLEQTDVLLQHTRIVPRKKIELAIDFAFKLQEKYLAEQKKKCTVLLVSGHS